ncbi:PDZ domain (Also known as DHR or GLGF) domain-containing protein [Ditylenchus destructor]|uniref:PDZ domain (Also known as DHR or GLGF) domain-containing protein n=1 Tax=Ditylenchus destructor TaxID=166010 RepID=A0AAD4R8N4_9BILA|nr:PDZ domain (Also known as DHR or GLGF) domain-containing protein [Ditylenchus destructor]
MERLTAGETSRRKGNFISSHGDNSSKKELVPSKTSAFHTNVPTLHWLDALERDFDKAFVDLDLMLGDFDSDQSDLTFECRQKLIAISSVFAQMIHKTQSLFHRTCSVEDELKETKDALCTSLASQCALEEESQSLMLKVHSLQCQIHSKTAPHESDMIKKKLEQEIKNFRANFLPSAKLETEVDMLKKENRRLRHTTAAMQTEVYGARLAAKYLDKELAGRIQQIQLLGRDMRGTEHDRLWSQLEAEIHLHRHKTVIKACRGREYSKALPRPSEEINEECTSKNNKGVGKPRRVKLTKMSNEGLGISITGGREHGIPVLISEVHHGQPADRCGNLFVGDAILSVNGIDLRSARHTEAVEILSKEMAENDELLVEVVFVSPSEDSDDEADVIVSTEDGSLFNLYDPDLAEAAHSLPSCSESNGRSSTSSSAVSSCCANSSANSVNYHRSESPNEMGGVAQTENSKDSSQANSDTSEVHNTTKTVTEPLQ